MNQLRVTEKASPTDSRQNNRALLLQHLFHDGEMSRADLSRVSGLTRMSVSDLVAELDSEGLLLDLGTRARSKVGKPPTLIALDDNARHVISLNLSDDHRVTGALLNLRGEILERQEAALRGQMGEDAANVALGLARDLKQASKVPVLGVGIGSPGVVNRNGVILEAPNLGWVNQALAGPFSHSLGVPTHVVNDANAATLAIHTFHEGGGKNMMLVLIGQGVGAGLIIDGALVQGDAFTAGEIGHIVMDEEGALCSCGRRGCLETLLSVSNLGKQLSAADVEQQQRLLRKAGRSLGAALTPIIAALGISAVALAGPAEFMADALCEEVRSTVERRTLPAVTGQLQVDSATNPGDLVLQGAAALVLSNELGIS